jgi:ribose 1,5-bisphosphokinase PhnN
MQPPAPFPVPGPSGAGGDSPARTAAALTRALARHGITRVYTSASEQYAVISVNADLTVWTNGRQIWCTVQGQRYTWAASETETAAARIAALAGRADAP